MENFCEGTKTRRGAFSGVWAVLYRTTTFNDMLNNDFQPYTGRNWTTLYYVLTIYHDDIPIRGLMVTLMHRRSTL
jgi:hypothetical protein